MKGRVYCSNCRFFDPKTSVTGKPTDWGLCRFNPPVKSNVYLEVYETDWCGQGLPQDNDE